jgi:hypothetical protein
LPHRTVPPAFAHLNDALVTCVRSDPSGYYELGSDSSLLLHLRDGAPVYAEGRNVPGLGARLVARGRITRQAWDEMFARPVPRLGERLVAARVVSPRELDELLRSILVDALLCFALGPDQGAPAPRTSSRQADWLGWRATASLDDVLHEVGGLVNRLSGVGIDADAVLERSPSPPAPVVITAGQWEVVWRADGRSSARDICRATGLSVAEILLAERDLVGSGLCRVPGVGPTPAAEAPVRHEPSVLLEQPVHFAPPAEHEPPAHQERPRDAPAHKESLPQRRRGRSSWDFGSPGGGGAEPPPEPAWEPVARPDLDLVRQILQGLREL